MALRDWFRPRTRAAVQNPQPQNNPQAGASGSGPRPQQREAGPDPVQAAQHERGQQTARMRNVRQAQRQTAQEPAVQSPQPAPQRRGLFASIGRGFQSMRLQYQVAKLQKDFQAAHTKGAALEEKAGMAFQRTHRIKETDAFQHGVKGEVKLSPTEKAVVNYSALKYEKDNYPPLAERYQQLTRQLQDFLPPENRLTSVYIDAIDLDPVKGAREHKESIPLIPPNFSLGNGLGARLGRLFGGMSNAETTSSAATPLDYNGFPQSRHDFYTAQSVINTHVRNMSDAYRHADTLESYTDYANEMEKLHEEIGNREYGEMKAHWDEIGVAPPSSGPLNPSPQAEAQPTLTEAETQAPAREEAPAATTQEGAAPQTVESETIEPETMTLNDLQQDTGIQTPDAGVTEPVLETPQEPVRSR